MTHECEWRKMCEGLTCCYKICSCGSLADIIMCSLCSSPTNCDIYSWQTRLWFCIPWLDFTERCGKTTKTFRCCSRFVRGETVDNLHHRWTPLKDQWNVCKILTHTSHKLWMSLEDYGHSITGWVSGSFYFCYNLWLASLWQRWDTNPSTLKLACLFGRCLYHPANRGTQTHI